MRPLVVRWKSVTVDMLEELWRAREALSSQGARTDLVTNDTRFIWAGYLQDISLNRMTAHRWLAQYDPETNSIREIEPPARLHIPPASSSPLKNVIKKYTL